MVISPECQPVSTSYSNKVVVEEIHDGARAMHDSGRCAEISCNADYKKVGLSDRGSVSRVTHTSHGDVIRQQPTMQPTNEVIDEGRRRLDRARFNEARLLFVLVLALHHRFQLPVANIR